MVQLPFFFNAAVRRGSFYLFRSVSAWTRVDVHTASAHLLAGTIYNTCLEVRCQPGANPVVQGCGAEQSNDRVSG